MLLPFAEAGINNGAELIWRAAGGTDQGKRELDDWGEDFKRHPIQNANPLKWAAKGLQELDRSLPTPHEMNLPRLNLPDLSFKTPTIEERDAWLKDRGQKVEKFFEEKPLDKFGRWIREW